MRFEAYHWHVQDLGDTANDTDAISAAFQKAKEITDKPSLIILRTHIGYGSPGKQDTAAAHGSPLGDKEVSLTKKFYGWPDEKFLVPDDVKEHMHRVMSRGEQQEKDWINKLHEYGITYPELASQFDRNLRQELPAALG